jgi:hypothetical protein
MIYDKVTISGIEVEEVKQLSVDKSIGENNISSTFDLSLKNYAGMNISKYNVGDEVIVYADKDVNPPTTVLFTGILENISFDGQGLRENIRLDGRDYTARLMDRTVEPEVYTSLPAGSIVKDIIVKYTNDINTGSVQDSPTVVDRIAFNHMPVFDAVKKLADLSNHTFFVDNDKYLHFEPKSSVSTGYTFNSGNVVSANFDVRRDTMYNQIWVYGDRYLDGYIEKKQGNGTGSVFTLLYKPHNTSILVGGSPCQPGGVYGMTNVAGSVIRYLVNYEDKQIIFTSGTLQGMNIPHNNGSVWITYDRSLPIIKVGDNEPSKAQYGQRTRVITDKDIKDPATAEAVMIRELDKSSIPAKQGDLLIQGIVNVIPGQTCVVDLPFHEVNNQTYDILEASYDFNEESNFDEEVLSIKVNKRLDDVTDTLKDLILDLKKIKGGDISDADNITRYQYTIGSEGIVTSGLNIYMPVINDSFVLGHPLNGVLGVVSPNSIGSVLGSCYWETGAGIGYDRCLGFTGSSGFVWVRDNSDICGIGSFDNYSLSFWVKCGSIASDASISEHWQQTVSGEDRRHAYPWALRMANTSGISFNIYDGAANPGVSIPNTDGVVDNGWNHAVFIRHVGSDAMYAYKNGSLVGTSTDTTMGYVKNGSNGFVIGGRTYTTSDTSQKYWNGQLDDFRVYGKGLTQNEIGSLYAKVNYPIDRLLYYAKFDEGIGSTIYNSASIEHVTGDALFHFRFNNSGASIIDESGGRIGSVISPTRIQWTNGVYGNGSAIYISGTSNAAGFNLYNEDASLRFNEGSSFTLTVWHKVVSGNFISSSPTGIIMKGSTSAANYGIQLVSGANNIAKYEFGWRSGATGHTVTSVLVPRSQWNFIAGVYDGTNYPTTPMQIFINGSPGSIIDTAGSAFNGGLGSLTIGNALSVIGGNTETGIQVMIDEVKMYRRALSSGEIYNLYAGKTIQPLLGDRRTDILVWSGGY